jgi:hypothetical protein
MHVGRVQGDGQAGRIPREPILTFVLTVERSRLVGASTRQRARLVSRNSEVIAGACYPFPERMDK